MSTPIDTMTPNPIDPGPGWRLLTAGEAIQRGDEYYFCPNEYITRQCLWWSCEGRIGTKANEGEIIRRRIAPQPACEGQSFDAPTVPEWRILAKGLNPEKPEIGDLWRHHGQWKRVDQDHLDLNAGQQVMSCLYMRKATMRKATQRAAPEPQTAGDAAERAAERIAQRWDALDKNGDGHGSTCVGLAEIIRQEFAAPVPDVKGDDFCETCHRYKNLPEMTLPCCCEGIQTYAMSAYPGEYKLVKAHPANSSEQQWYKREDVDARLAAMRAEFAPMEARLREYERATTDERSLHANIPRGTFSLSRASALHIAGATDYDAIKARVAELDGALRQCRDRFDSYARKHAAKNSIEGAQKARSNLDMAALCEAALQQTEKEEV